VSKLASKHELEIDVEKIKKDMDYVREKLDDIHHKLVGNGKPGLLEEFILKLPKLAYADKIKCQCGADINIYMEGLENFFV